MTAMRNCPGCNGPLRLRDDLAGREVQCPRCGHVLTVPAAGAAGEITAEPPRPRRPAEAPRAYPDEDDDAPRVRAKFKPCPRCGEEGATRVIWTPWGSFYGPALFTHVRCPACGYAYNGRTGRSNLLPAIVFVAVPAVLILAILGLLGWVIYATVGSRP